MKVSAFLFATLLASASISTASAHCQCANRVSPDCLGTGTIFENGQQYANGGKFSGISPGITGGLLDVARCSIDPFGAPELFASAWRIPPAVAKGK